MNKKHFLISGLYLGVLSLVGISAANSTTNILMPAFATSHEGITAKGASNKHFIKQYKDDGASTINFVSATFSLDLGSDNTLNGDMRAGVSINGDDGFLATYIYYKEQKINSIAISFSDETCKSETDVNNPWDRMFTIYNATADKTNPKQFTPTSSYKTHTLSMYRNAEKIYIAIDGSQMLTAYTSTSGSGYLTFADIKSSKYTSNLTSETNLYPSLSIMSGTATYVSYDFAQGDAATNAWNNMHKVEQTADTVYSSGFTSGKDSRGSYGTQNKITMSAEEQSDKVYIETDFKATALNTTSSTNNFNMLGFRIKNITNGKWLGVYFKVAGGAASPFQCDCTYVTKTSSLWWNGTAWNDSSELGKVSLNDYNKLGIYRSGTTLKVYINDQLSNNTALANFDLTDTNAMTSSCKDTDKFEYYIDIEYAKSFRYSNVQVYTGDQADAIVSVKELANALHPEIPFTDNSNTGNCLTYYGNAKTLYNSLTVAGKEVFNYASPFAYFKDRLSAWARANNDSLTLLAIIPNDVTSFSANSKTTMPVIIVIISVSIMAIGTLLIIKRKKTNK